jgi:16S rRNA (guanine1516-N2)-methyltransferase
VQLKVDFISGALAHRRKYGGGKSQLIAKAVGIKPGIFPSVLDLTAGLGKDAFVLATLGCQVTLLERNPLVFNALQEGIRRARDYAENEDEVLLQILQRMTLLNRDSLDFLRETATVDQQVIYLDPMFPERKKSAAVKKDMVLMQEIVGADEDSDHLFLQALQADVCRIVVKRPKLAPPLAHHKPVLVFQGQSSRFDIYPKKTLV